MQDPRGLKPVLQAMDTRQRIPQDEATQGIPQDGARQGIPQDGAPAYYIYEVFFFKFVNCVEFIV